jgi:hypothetical protein
VLTQYKAHSLIRHLVKGWSTFQSELGEFYRPPNAPPPTGIQEPPTPSIRTWLSSGHCGPSTFWFCRGITSIRWAMARCWRITSKSRPR